MKKKQILKLIDECPYWGEDIESEIMIKDLKKWFEFNLKDEENEDPEKFLKEEDEFITKKEFRLEIDKLWNEIRQTIIKLIGCNTDAVITHTYDRSILSDKTISVS